MSAKMRRRVTAERRFLAARTMLPRLTLLQGSSANSRAARDMVSPWAGGEEGQKVILNSRTLGALVVMLSNYTILKNCMYIK